jgi:hypothetical protein
MYCFFSYANKFLHFFFKVTAIERVGKTLCCGPRFSFLVLIVSTQNVLLSLMAILTVFSIIMATAAILLLLGMLKLKLSIRGLVKQRLGYEAKLVLECGVAKFGVWRPNLGCSVVKVGVGRGQV